MKPISTTTNMHIGLQNIIHLPHTKTKVLKVTMINLWFEKDEIHTLRIHL
jgi:hypothetical protein